MAESNQVEDYNIDPRIPCKYGSSCYRRNKSHLDKFKHPPGICEVSFAFCEIGSCKALGSGIFWTQYMYRANPQK